MTAADHAAAAEVLIRAAAERVQAPAFSSRWTDMTLADAYAIQREVSRRRVAAGRRVIGHKVGLTSKAMQRSVGVAEPDYGVLFDDMLYSDGGSIRAADFCVPRVEVELTFVLAKPLRGPGIGLVEVLRATEFVVPSLELIDARLKDPRKIVDTVSDNGAAAGIVLGGRPVGPMEVDLRWVGCALYLNGVIEETGLASGVMGHPAMGIAWLANAVGPLGVTLEPGHHVLSGSFTRPVWCRAGDTVQADFGALGQVSCRFE